MMVVRLQNRCHALDFVSIQLPTIFEDELLNNSILLNTQLPTSTKICKYRVMKNNKFANNYIYFIPDILNLNLILNIPLLHNF